MDGDMVLAARVCGRSSGEGELVITALVGGQFGSEGKGLIAGHIGHKYKHHVRVGAANAGHTVYTWPTTESQPDAGYDAWDGPEKHVLQQIPCGAYVRPDACLYIGPGALISPGIFLAELDQLAKWRTARGLDKPTVFVDRRAHVIQEHHIMREQESGLDERIGSTSTIAKEGIGVAQAARVMREDSCILAGEDSTLYTDPRVSICSVPFALSPRVRTKDGDHDVLLEGTQGYGLSLTTGDFPYVTSRNTTAAGLAADVGIPPNHIDHVVAVFRTYPIRVAGNSGPFHYGSEEISWDGLGVDPDSERTTVTKKIRRVATFSYEQAWEACLVNGVTAIALTFADYVDPRIGDVDGLMYKKQLKSEYPDVFDIVRELERTTEVPVIYIGTGPHSVIEYAH